MITFLRESLAKKLIKRGKRIQDLSTLPDIDSSEALDVTELIRNKCLQALVTKTPYLNIDSLLLESHLTDRFADIMGSL
jgi:hypothetical protein